jgi:hypothetical protein
MSTAAIAAGRTAPLHTYGQHGSANAAINDLTNFFRKNDPQGGSYPVVKWSQGENTFKNLETFIRNKKGQLTPALHAELTNLLARFATETQKPGGMYRGGVSSRLGEMGVDTTLQGNGSAPAGRAPAGRAPAAPAAGAPAAAGGGAPAGAGAPEQISADLQAKLQRLNQANKWAQVDPSITQLFSMQQPNKPEDVKSFNKLKTNIKEYLDKKAGTPTAHRDIDRAKSEQELLEGLFNAGGNKREVAIALIKSAIYQNIQESYLVPAPQPPAHPSVSTVRVQPPPEAAAGSAAVIGGGGDVVVDDDDNELNAAADAAGNWVSPTGPQTDGSTRTTGSASTP